MQHFGLLKIKYLQFQVAAIVLAAIYKGPAGDEARKFAKYTLKKYYRDADHRDAVTLSWDFMMAEVRSFKNIFKNLQLVLVVQCALNRVSYFFAAKMLRSEQLRRLQRG